MITSPLLAATTFHVMEGIATIRALLHCAPENFLDYVRLGMHGEHGHDVPIPYGVLGSEGKYGPDGTVIRGRQSSVDMYNLIFRTLKPEGTFFLNSCGGADASSGDSQLHFIIHTFEMELANQHKLIQKQLDIARLGHLSSRAKRDLEEQQRSGREVAQGHCCGGFFHGIGASL